MARVYVKIGPKVVEHAVDGLPFLPGLCMHKVPYSGKSSSVYNITHTQSGLAVLSKVDEANLELIRMILGRMLWDKTTDIIFDESKYYSLVKEAEAVLSNHRESEKQEKRIAKDIKGKRQPASGSRWGSKRDVITPDLLIEAKTTKSSRQSVSIKDLHFLTRQAYQQGKVPAYIIEFARRWEVVLVPVQELAESTLEEFEETRNLDYKKRKSFSVSTGLADWVSSENCALIETSETTYALISYCSFLEIAKRGI